MHGYLGRFWRRIRLGRNPLARASDRIEAAMLIIVMLGILVALPLAAATGSTTYAEQLAASTEQRASTRLATATLIADAPLPVPSTEGTLASRSTNVKARWEANGVEHTGNIFADPGTAKGTQVPIWLSRSGDPVPQPATPADAATTGVLAGVFVWLVVGMSLIALFWGTRWILDRRRAALWAREWATIGARIPGD